MYLVCASLRTTEHTPTFSTFHNLAAGFTEEEAARRLHLFGENFMKIEVLSVWQLLVQQVSVTLPSFGAQYTLSILFPLLLYVIRYILSV